MTSRSIRAGVTSRTAVHDLTQEQINLSRAAQVYDNKPFAR